jgi:hypothetical protein
MKTLLISIGIILVAGILLFRWFSTQEEPEKYYLSRQEIVTDDAIGRGWVPSWLPTSAHSINETHNIDTNEVWMKFKFNTNEIIGIEACSIDNTTDFKKANGPRVKNHSWWVKPEGNDWEGYICKWKMVEHPREARLIVSKNNGIALYWEEH